MYLTKNPKSPFYQLVYFVHGKRTTISTKTKNEKEAIRFLKSFEKPDHDRELIIKPITLSKFQDEYVDYIQQTKSKSYVRSVKLSFKMLIEFTGDIYLSRLDLRTLDKFITSTFQRTQRGSSLYYRTLKAAFSKAVLWNYLIDNPLKQIKSPKVSKSFPVFISENELRIILEKTQKAYLKDLFTTAFYTGMRLGELLNMKWSWIDFTQNYITVQCSESFQTKSKKDRIVPMSEKVRSLLTSRFKSNLHSPEEFVFYHFKGRKLHQETISKQFKDVVRKLNLDDKIHFHTLRHSFASMLVQRGVSLYVVKELLGHEDLSTTQIYSHLQSQNLKDAVNLL